MRQKNRYAVLVSESYEDEFARWPDAFTNVDQNSTCWNTAMFLGETMRAECRPRACGGGARTAGEAPHAPREHCDANDLKLTDHKQGNTDAKEDGHHTSSKYLTSQPGSSELVRSKLEPRHGSGNAGTAACCVYPALNCCERGLELAGDLWLEPRQEQKKFPQS